MTAQLHAMARCFVCGARAYRSAPPLGRVCLHCGLRWDGRDAKACRRQLAHQVGSGRVDLGGRAARWTMDVYTLRIAASAWRRSVNPESAAQHYALARPHSRLPAVARTVQIASERPVPLTLGILARPSELAAVLRATKPLLPLLGELIVLIDAEKLPVETRCWPSGMRAATRPLDSNFASARNWLQSEARTEWVLQLDTDETLAPAALDVLARQARVLELQGVQSIGLPRLNLVNGRLSDLWPDVQYRLNRRSVRYTGRVHERPDLGGAWWLSTVVQSAPIIHRLDHRRVAVRSQAYEALTPGGGRPAEARALLTPFAA